MRHDGPSLASPITPSPHGSPHLGVGTLAEIAEDEGIRSREGEKLSDTFEVAIALPLLSARL